MIARHQPHVPDCYSFQIWSPQPLACRVMRLGSWYILCWWEHLVCLGLDWNCLGSSDWIFVSSCNELIACVWFIRCCGHWVYKCLSMLTWRLGFWLLWFWSCLPWNSGWFPFLHIADWNDTSTRIANHSSACIDQIWCNNPKEIKRSFVIDDHRVADRLTIGIIRDEAVYDTVKTIRKRIFSDENLENTRQN